MLNARIGQRILRSSELNRPRIVFASLQVEIRAGSPNSLVVSLDPCSLQSFKNLTVVMSVNLVENTLTSAASTP